MQKNQQTPEKGLFTFYKQQQHFQAQHPIAEHNQNPAGVSRFSTKKKTKKKIKHQTELKQKSSHEDASKSEFQPIKQETQKKQKPHKKGNKLFKKKAPKQQATNNSTQPLKNSQTQDKKQHFLSIISSYNSNEKPIVNGNFQHSVSMVLNIQKKAKIPQMNRISSPTVKKTIISEANMTIKPFQKQLIYEEDDYLVNGFVSSFNLNTKNPQTKSEMNNQPQLMTKVQSALDNNQNQNIKDKFLSKVIRKNIVFDPSPGWQKKISFEKARCLTELSQKKDSLVGLFQNKQITESLVQKQKSEKSVVKNIEQTLVIKEKPPTQNKIDKYLRFESKTQELRKHSRIEKGQLRRCSKVTSVHLPNQKQENFRCEINSSSFMPVHSSSLAIQEVIKTQNSQIFESYDVYQHYRRLKTKSKKLLRFSMIKSHTTKGIENSKVLQEGKDAKEKDDKQEKKEGQPKSVQTLKLPIITNGCRNIDKQKPRVLSSDQKSTQNDKKVQIVKSSANHKSESFEKNKPSHQPKQMKQRLRFYTEQHQCDTSQIDMIKSKILTIIDTEKRDSNRSRLQQQPEESLHKKFIQKSVSTKIIQNFQQKHYRKAEQQKEGSKLSTLDMSQYFIMNWKESLDWQSKKKLIVKKLGIKI